MKKKITILCLIVLSCLFLDCPGKPSPKLIGSLNSIAASIPSGAFSITESGGNTSVAEGTETDTYTISLNAQPTANVVINLAFDITQLKINSSIVSPVQLTFTSTNWSTAQTVTVEALYDTVAEGTDIKSITHTSSSPDFNYNGLTISSVNVSITDTVPATVKGSFQSGNFTLASNPQNIILTTVVDSTKAFVICNAKMTGSSVDNAIACQLNTAGTQIIFTSGGGTGARIDWYVMEYSSGATVQRGSTSFITTDTTLNSTLSSSISQTKTFVIGYAVSPDGGSTTDGYRTIRTRLTSSTNLEFARNQTGGTATVEWQVVQFDGSKVQSGTVSITNGNSSASAALSNSVNLNSSFLILNYKAATAIGGVERDFYVRGSYSDSSTLSFNRVGTSQDVDISWFAVEMVDGTTVQSGTALMGAGAGTTASSTLATAVTTTKSMIIFSNDTDSLVPTNSSTQDSGTYTSTFNSTTQVNFDRFNDETNGATINWYVISFQ